MSKPRKLLPVQVASDRPPSKGAYGEDYFGSDRLGGYGIAVGDADRVAAARWLRRHGHHDVIEILGLATMDGAR